MNSLSSHIIEDFTLPKKEEPVVTEEKKEEEPRRRIKRGGNNNGPTPADIMERQRK
jgi:hypothetical protein